MSNNYVSDHEVELLLKEDATVTWHGFFGNEENYDTLLLHVASPVDAYEPVLLRLHRVEFVDCPMKMARVRLRVGFRKGLAFYERLRPTRQSDIDRALNDDSLAVLVSISWNWSLRNGLLSIECDQGVFFILAGGLEIEPFAEDEGNAVIRNIPIFSAPALAVSEPPLFWRNFDSVELGMDTPLWFGGPTFSEL